MLLKSHVKTKTFFPDVCSLLICAFRMCSFFSFVSCKLKSFIISLYINIFASDCLYFSELNSKLQDTLEMIEEQLDVALSKTCNNFDVGHYEKVQTAYRLLGKTQVSPPPTHTHTPQNMHLATT